MKPSPDLPCVLAINGGSSSIRLALYEVGPGRRAVLAGKVDRIGSGTTTLSVSDSSGGSLKPRPLIAADFGAAVARLLDWLEAQPHFGAVKAVGHRVVHGLRHSEPERVTQYAIRNSRGFTHYNECCWGITASDGPGLGTRVVQGTKRVFYDYIARGAPFGPDDGTLAPWAVVASLPFAPRSSCPRFQTMSA